MDFDSLPPSLELLLNLTIALGIGLLIGLERSWRERDDAEADQSAGVRTFALTGLLGGLAMLLAQVLGPSAWMVLFGGLVALMVFSYLGDLRRTGDQGITTELALCLTFALGSLAMAGYPLLSGAGAVIVALVLNLKEVLHASLKRLSAAELSGALKLLFISVVVLPVLPDATYGPWDLFNPRSVWWMVVLIAALGFIAYIAVRVVGTRYGLMLTAALGSLVSSTAMTLTLARLAQPGMQALLSAALLTCSALMFPRVLLEVAVVNPALLPALTPALAAATLVYLAGAAVFWWHASHAPVSDTATPLRNPFELMPAVRFALLLVAILFLVEAGRRYLGDAGVYLVSVLAGLTDVDAITLTLARSSLHDLDATLAVHGIVLAVVSNSLVKGGLIVLVGGAALARRTLPVIGLGLLAAGATLAWN